MNIYLSKEDLDMIVKEPTYETIKVLYNKFYKVETESKGVISLNNNEDTMVGKENSALISNNKELPIVEVPPVTNISNINSNPIENVSINPTVQTSMPTFEIPKIEVPTPVTNSNNSSNNAPVSFSGNIFEPQKPNMDNLMQTTDNFTMSSPSEVNSIDIQASNKQFFGNQMKQEVNNPIPIYGGNQQSQNNRMTGYPQNPQAQTMFGQIQSNYRAA